MFAWGSMKQGYTYAWDRACSLHSLMSLMRLLYLQNTQEERMLEKEQNGKTGTENDNQIFKFLNKNSNHKDIQQSYQSKKKKKRRHDHSLCDCAPVKERLPVST